MAIYTLSTSANYSAIKGSLANGDTIRIDTNAVRLTIDEQPVLTGITVDSPGVSGRVTVSGAYDLSTWSMTSGTATLIDGTFPAGATLGTATGGAAFCVNINNGTITTVQGGTVTGAGGVTTNNGTITTATGGSGTTCPGVTTNSATGTIGTANGTTGNSSQGCLVNNGYIGTANGGTGGFPVNGVGNNNGTINVVNGRSANGVNANTATGIVNFANGSTISVAFGISSNSGFVGVATGGAFASASGVSTNSGWVQRAIGGTNATAYGINTNEGQCFEAADNTARGVNAFRGGPKLINGPEFKTGTTNYVNVPRIYSIGQVSGSAAIPGAIPITILTEGSGGFSGIKGIDRNIGT
jgi:hypothetical protein